MSLVEDDGIVVGKDAGAVAPGPQSQIREVERVVHDHELRLTRALARRLRVARRDERAALPLAAVGADREVGPERCARLELELRPVSRLRRFDPVPQPLVLTGVSLGPEEGRPRSAEELEPVQALPAEVVLAPLQDGAANLPSQSALGRRDVLREELVLKRFRRCRYDHTLTGKKGRDEVRQALTRSGSGLRQEVLAAFEGIGDGSRELALLSPRLEARQDGGKWTGSTEERLHEWAQRLERSPAIIGEHLF